MKKFKFIPFIAIFLFINFAFAQNYYLETLRLQILFRLANLNPNPIQKISILNSIAEKSLEIYKSLPSDKKIKFLYNNYLKSMNALEKEWKNLSFTYSQYPNFYQKSLDLYFNHLSKFKKKEITNKNIEESLIRVLSLAILKVDSQDGLNYVVSLAKKYNLDLNEIKISGDVEKIEKIDYQELVRIMNEFKQMVNEFEKGERIVVSNYEEVEEKAKEIKNEVYEAQKNLIKMDLESFNKNIAKIKENLEFIKKNSKKVK